MTASTIDPGLFRWNPDATIRVEHIGADASPVIIVDDVLADPDGLRTVARDQQYTAIGAFYPGIRCPLPEDYSRTVLENLTDRLKDLYGPDADGLFGESFLSLVTTPPHRLKPIQRLPHFDGYGDDQFAAIAYLSGEDHGGTSFFRHRTTGFERISGERFPAYRAALEKDTAEHGLPAEAYVSDGAPLFERLHTVNARFNRLVFYRGSQLHSGAIENPMALDADPARGRLTITSFFKARG